MSGGQRAVLIGGSGPSLQSAELARVPASVQVVRVNNFFLEPRYHLGRRVDCVYFSADPRAVRFYLATLRRVIARREYDVRGSASHLPEAAHFRPPEPFVHRTTWPREIEHLLDRIIADQGVRPTSGAMAMLHARAGGAARLLLAGIDMYGSAKYSFDVPPRLAKVLSPNLNATGYDTRLHSHGADLQVITWLLEAGVSLERVSPEPVAGIDLPLAPVVDGEEPLSSPSTKPPRATDDWVERDGLWTVTGLAAARAMRRHLPIRRLPAASRGDIT